LTRRQSGNAREAKFQFTAACGGRRQETNDFREFLCLTVIRRQSQLGFRWSCLPAALRNPAQ
jgi:hypothetical protein